MARPRVSLAAVVALVALAACADRSDAEFQADVSSAMHIAVTENLADLLRAACSLQAAAPSRAWKPDADHAAILEMIEAWKRTRIAWEHVEGAVAPLFPELNATMDARYEDLLAASDGDRNPFDGRGVVGMHAIERILFAPDTRAEVIAFERTIPGYRPAGYPSTDNDAIAFKFQLVQRLVDDATELAASWNPAEVDVGVAYRGLAGLMHEQQEKIDLAASGSEESRYSNVTLFDLRNNLEGTARVYGMFRDWIHTRDSAERSDRQILDRFLRLGRAYATTGGDALPEVPADWNSEYPTPGALHTPFGMLWIQVRESVDPNSSGSLVYEMNRVADLLGIPELAER